MKQKQNKRKKTNKNGSTGVCYHMKDTTEKDTY